MTVDIIEGNPLSSLPSGLPLVNSVSDIVLLCDSHSKLDVKAAREAVRFTAQFEARVEVRSTQMAGQSRKTGFIE